MKINRRQLMITSGAIAGAGILASCGSAGAAQSTALTEAAIEADPVLQMVASFVGKYSQNHTFQTMMVGEERHCRIQAPIADLNQFVQTFTKGEGIPFEPIWCEGSQMSFQHKGTFFVLTHKI